jgi:NADH:ubiquinone oxidoreductase subunit 5 (subunit L)/multisubunit Na+/H+ antiporter MnhA subunit
MEGPTPVSALIHAATMVTAGIFLLIRCSFLFEMSDNIRNLIVILGAFTAFFSAFTAIFLYDIKKIIAYSTCSQLGYMALACGLSQYTIGFFHLINHAFFKALLFLTAGAIIHSFNNEQDMRKLSGLYTRMPFIHSAILIGNIAIMGLPFLSGFYSKDLVIEVTYLKGFNIFNAATININLVFIIILLATLCTGIYSLRMYYYLFLRQGAAHKADLRSASFEQPFFIQLALGVLMIGSIFSGYFLSDIFAVTNDFFHHGYDSINHEEIRGLHFENEFLPWYIKLAPLLCNMFSIVGGVAFISLYQVGVIPQFTHLLLAHLSKDIETYLRQTTVFASFYL